MKITQVVSTGVEMKITQVVSTGVEMKITQVVSTTVNYGFQSKALGQKQLAGRLAAGRLAAGRLSGWHDDRLADRYADGLTGKQANADKLPY